MTRDNNPDILCPACNEDLVPGKEEFSCLKCQKSYKRSGNILFLDEDVYEAENDSNLKKDQTVYTNSFSKNFLYKNSKDLGDRVKSYHQFFIQDNACKKIVEEKIKENVSGLKLDIGCGLGIPLYPIGPNVCENNNIIGLDLSVALLKQADKQNRFNNPLILANAQKIPFHDNVFDLVLSRHMLYHVGNIDAVCGEVKRVMKNDGIFLATTNSIHGKKRLFDLHFEALQELNEKADVISRGTARFSLENGASILEKHFNEVETIEWNGFFQFPTTEDFMLYYTSTPYFKKAFKNQDGLQSLYDLMAQKVNSIINDNQNIIIKNVGGVFICRN